MGAEVNHRSFFGMMNVGIRPTVNGKHETLEVHLFDCEENLYDLNLKIEFIEKIRDEVKFQSFDHLKIQLEKDKEVCKRTLISKGIR